MNLGIKKIAAGMFCAFLLIGCAGKITTFTLEDVEKQRIAAKNGKQKALVKLTEIYKDKNQTYDVRLAAIRALSESRDPKVVGDIQSVVKNASLIELELMLEAVKILVSYQDPASTDSLIAALKSTERKSMEIRESIVEAIGKNGSKDEIYTLIELYQVSKTNNARMNKLLATTLGEIGDEKVIPILMEIAKNKNLHVSIRNQAVEVLAKKQAPELVDFFAEMIGDPATRDKVNEYALTVMGELGEERMILALLEAYQVGKHEYFSLMNTVLTSLDNYDNPGMKPIYLEIAKTEEYPSNIRLKALRELTRYSDPEVISAIVDMLNHPGNYLYYNEIIAMLRNYELYEDYKPKLRMGAYNAMMEHLGRDTPIGVFHD